MLPDITGRHFTLYDEETVANPPPFFRPKTDEQQRRHHSPIHRRPAKPACDVIGGRRTLAACDMLTHG